MASANQAVNQQITEREQEVAILKNAAENCVCRGDETKCLNTISREERLGQFKSRLRESTVILPLSMDSFRT